MNRILLDISQLVYLQSEVSLDNKVIMIYSIPVEVEH
jgi:hypothetical protein